MKDLIVKSFEIILKIVAALIILMGAVIGYQSAGIIGFIGGLIGAILWAVIVLGGLFLIMDIAENTRAIKRHLESRQ
ncbi:MAG: hypothetical protein ACLFQK_10655 [Fibrobacterota bacterium]